MTTKKIGSEVGSAKYLSPMDLKRAKKITNALKNAGKVEDVIYYQKLLERLMLKAERNKSLAEKQLLQQALRLKKMDRDEVKSKYLAKVGDIRRHKFEIRIRDESVEDGNVFEQEKQK